MLTTSPSLLRRLSSDDREAAWERFVQLYAPLIHHWILQSGVSGADVADCAQEVFSVLVAKVPALRYDAGRSFRGWLRTVTVNKCRDMLRRDAAAPRPTVAFDPGQHAVAAASEPIGEEEYRRVLVHRALEIMQSEFEPLTWQACWEHVATGERASAIARRLGMTENAVHLAKSRLLRRLRQELEGLWE